MDSFQMMNQRKTEFKEDIKPRQEPENRVSMPALQEMQFKDDAADDLYFESSAKELEQRRYSVPADPEADVALEMQRSRRAGTVYDPAMMKKTREAVAPDPDAVEAPENSLLKEEKKSEVPINVIDMKNAEKQLDVTKLREGVKKKENSVKKKEKKAPEDHSLPEGLKETLRSIINDKRGASGYYSAVQEAAKKVLALDLNSTKNRKEAYSSMAELMNAAILYRDKRPGGRFLKKGKERARWMDSLINGMKDFTVDKDPVYMFNITKEWQENLMDEKGYPEHLAKWMTKEAQKLPSAFPNRKFKITEYSFVRSIVAKTTSMNKHLADEAGWKGAINESKTNVQYSRVSPIISGYNFIGLHSDGSAADEEAEQKLATDQEAIECMKRTLPAERAKALDPVIQRFLDLKLTPEMLKPSYYIRHMHELAAIGEDFTLFENLFISDNVNAAYLKSLPKTVRDRMDFISNYILTFQYAFSLISNSFGVSGASMLQEDEKVQEMLADEKKYGPLIDQLTAVLEGKQSTLKLVEYKKGMAVKNGVTYYTKNPVEGMPDDTLILNNPVMQIVVENIARFNNNSYDYRKYLSQKTDLSEELKKSGTAVNDELIKDVVLPEDCQSVKSAQQLTDFWKKTIIDSGADPAVWTTEDVYDHINIRKNISLRNEKLKKVMDTNPDLTTEQLTSLDDEINANMGAILQETKSIEIFMESHISLIYRTAYFDAHKEEGMNAKPKAFEAGSRAVEEFRKNRAEAFIPPKEETKEERDQKIAVFIARQKKLNPDFDEKWGELIYLDNERQNQNRLLISDKDHKDILRKYKNDVQGGLDGGNMDRQFLMPVLHRIKFTPSGEFASKKDFEEWNRNQRIINALISKNDEVLTTEVKNYLVDLFNDTPEVSEDMLTPDYALKNPEKIVATPRSLFYTNVSQSNIPAVKKAFTEFQSEHPEAAKWLYDRLEVHEEAFAMAHYLMNGYSDTALNYENRFKSNVTEPEKESAKAQIEFHKKELGDAVKNREKKPQL